jgi:dCMP deaminase
MGRSSKNSRLDDFYFAVANAAAKLSYCQNAQVGAVIVLDRNICAYGYNGTPIGHDNCCEDDGVTKKTVIHAEMNAIAKAASSGVMIKGSTIYCTLSPCIECAKMIIQSGISELVVQRLYRDTDGLSLAKNHIKTRLIYE